MSHLREQGKNFEDLEKKMIELRNLQFEKQKKRMAQESFELNKFKNAKDKDSIEILKKKSFYNESYKKEDEEHSESSQKAYITGHQKRYSNHSSFEAYYNQELQSFKEICSEKKLKPAKSSKSSKSELEDLPKKPEKLVPKE